MNALVGARINATGLMSPSPEQRQETWREMQSMSQAGLLGRLKQLGVAPEAAQVKEATTKEQAEAIPGADDLDRMAFLRLLVTQLQNQDPLDPMDNTDMIAQLAQFSALEQMQNLNEGFQQFTETMGRSNFVSASSLLGRMVSGVTQEGEPITGEVNQVFMDNGKPYVRVGEDNVRVALASVTGIA